MRQRPFQQVDVFTATPYLGTPLAVVLDGEGLSGEQMQQFTNWTNLSQASFVLPPTEAGRVPAQQAADGPIWIGGHTVACVRGEVLP